MFRLKTTPISALSTHKPQRHALKRVLNTAFDHACYGTINRSVDAFIARQQLGSVNQIENRITSLKKTQRLSFTPISRFLTYSSGSVERLQERFEENPNNIFVQQRYLRYLQVTGQNHKIIELFTNPRYAIYRNDETLSIYNKALADISNVAYPSQITRQHSASPDHFAERAQRKEAVTSRENDTRHSHVNQSASSNWQEHSGQYQNHPSNGEAQNMSDPAFRKELKDILERGVVVDLSPSQSDQWKSGLIQMLRLLLFGIILYYIYTVYFSSSSKTGGGPAYFLQEKVGTVVEHTGKYFHDIKGIDEIKDELMDVVDFLKYPEKYQKFGARIPRGVLLVGPPGTGKTLLAKAVAQESGVKFISVCGSEFDQAFVGMGALRMRELFKQISPNEKAVIFIDEIDSIAKDRTSLRSYHQQTLNELLTQMDGFSSNNNIVVIGATNTSVDLLDPALLRPGRFDKTIEVPLPDSKGRKDIVEYYLQKRKYHANINTDTLSHATIGMTGAEIENCVNQAAIHAVRRGRESITMEDLDFGVDRQRMGVELSKREVHEEDRRITAYHEAGHALVSHLLGTELNRVHKITIIPRGAAGGYTSFIPSSDVELMPHYQLIKHIKTAFGGRIAEEILLGPECVTGGASGDLQQATHMARLMITVHGMSSLGRVHFNPHQLGEATLEKIDTEILRILSDCRENVRDMLNTEANRHALDRIAYALLQYETISGEEMIAILEGKEIVRDASGINFSPSTPSSSSNNPNWKSPLPGPIETSQSEL